MVIAGAGGHALEILAVLRENQYKGSIHFFDDVTALPAAKILEKYPIIHTIEDLRSAFVTDPEFIIAVGKPALRKSLAIKMKDAGGSMQSIISHSAFIGSEAVKLGEGLNIMPAAVITANISIGTGSLVHIHCSIHHDTEIGEYCELSPGCRILGKVKIGSFVSIGAGAVILPGIRLGDYAVIGAGAVVTKDVAASQTVTGVPAKPVER
jgi:sugar O-acyltransferase (sialic acid O-acetyltransferase NeuD family)